MKKWILRSEAAKLLKCSEDDVLGLIGRKLLRSETRSVNGKYVLMVSAEDVLQRQRVQAAMGAQARTVRRVIFTSI